MKRYTESLILREPLFKNLTNLKSLNRLKTRSGGYVPSIFSEGSNRLSFQGDFSHIKRKSKSKPKPKPKVRRKSKFRISKRSNKRLLL